MPEARAAAVVGAERAAARSAWVRWTVAWVLFVAAMAAGFATFGEVDAERLLAGTPRVAAAVTSVALLAADILLPVPSSIVLTLNGALFRFWPGVGISLAGMLAGALLGYGLGRQLGPSILRVLGGARSMPSVAPFFEQYGVLAVVLTRPIPLIAEAVTCMAGTARMRFGPFLAAQTAGALPLCLGYAWVGSAAAHAHRSFLALTVAVFVPCLLWAIWSASRRPHRAPSDKENP